MVAGGGAADDCAGGGGAWLDAAGGGGFDDWAGGGAALETAGGSLTAGGGLEAGGACDGRSAEELSEGAGAAEVVGVGAAEGTADGVTRVGAERGGDETATEGSNVLVVALLDMAAVEGQCQARRREKK